MKLSVSISAEDAEFLDTEVCRAGLPGKSAAIQKAIQLLRDQALEEEYVTEWDAWKESGEEEVWSATLRDGLD